MTEQQLDRVAAILDEHLATAQRTRASLLPAIVELGADVCDALARGGKLVTFGNGGSAADAQHFAAELTGHFVLDRGPLAAVALTVDLRPHGHRQRLLVRGRVRAPGDGVVRPG